MAHLYIADDLTATAVGAAVTLRGPEARHAAGVSRLRVGESILVTNGCGLMLTCSATAVAKDEVSLIVESVVEVIAQTPQITLVQALAKGDRDERAIEMATELGISAIVPWQAARSISRWEGEKAVKGRDRWQSIVREASKQSIRAWVPSVAPVTTTTALVSACSTDFTLVLDPSGSLSLTEASRAALESQAQTISIVVGPEGGMAPEEVAALSGAGAQIVGLGSNILRTSTAGPSALAVLNELLARW